MTEREERIIALQDAKRLVSVLITKLRGGNGDAVDMLGRVWDHLYDQLNDIRERNDNVR